MEAMKRFRKIRFNKGVHKALMVWPGYLTKDTPQKLQEMLEEIGGYFTENPRKGSLSEIAKWIPVKTRSGIRVSILFQEDGTLDLLVIKRCKTIPVECAEEMCAWYMNAMSVLAKNGLIG